MAGPARCTSGDRGFLPVRPAPRNGRVTRVTPGRSPRPARLRVLDGPRQWPGEPRPRAVPLRRTRLGRADGARPGGRARRRELAGAGLPRGRRHPPVHRLGAGRVRHRRRRSGLRRPGLVLGRAAARARAPAGRAGGDRRCRCRHVVRRPDAGRGRAGRGDRRPGAGGAGTAGVVRHRGDHVRGPAGPRGDRPGPRGQVRRLLPRPRRRAARLGRLRGGDLRAAGHARCPRRRDRRDARAALQRHRRRHPGVRRARRRHRVRHHRGRLRQHGRGPAAARLQPVPRRDLPHARRAADQRRGHDRLPRAPLRVVGARRRGGGLAARPGDVRQGDGRGLPRRGVRRPRGRDGAAGAGGTRLPGGHAVR